MEAKTSYFRPETIELTSIVAPFVTSRPFAHLSVPSALQISIERCARASVSGEDILHALEWVPYHKGGTFTAEAIRIMREDVFDAGHGDRPDARNVALMITDGVSNILPQRTIPEARKVEPYVLNQS